MTRNDAKKTTTTKLFKNSKILNKNKTIIEFLNLTGLSSSNSNNYKLLYQASRNGFGAKDFHSHCDKITGTLILVKDTKSNIFGGFTKSKYTIKLHLFLKYKFIFTIRFKLIGP